MSSMRGHIDNCQSLCHHGIVNTAPIMEDPVAEACCAPVTQEAISLEDAQKFAQLLKAVADPTRLRLLSLVAAQESQEACVCDLTEPVGLGQPTVSHHLKILVDAGILHREKRGVWAYYSIVPGALERAAAVISPR